MGFFPCTNSAAVIIRGLRTPDSKKSSTCAVENIKWSVYDRILCLPVTISDSAFSAIKNGFDEC
jgi:hypothetical protein